MKRTLFIFSMLSLVLSACETTVELSGDTVAVEVAEHEIDDPVVTELPSAEVEEDAAAMERQRLIADILFEGLQALDEDRLLTPIDDSAHARFQRALAYDPDNEIALQGLKDIVARYIELSAGASRRGLFEEAEALLESARFVDESDPMIEAAWLEIQTERNTGDLFFELDGREVSRRSEIAQARLADIAGQAKELDAFFLITAPNDELARWMYAVMRDAVDGYRLRGNIELTSRTSIRLRVPDSSP